MPSTTLRLPVLMVLIIGTLVLVFFIVKPFLVVFALAVVCAVVLNPLYKKIRTRVGGGDTLATWITLSVCVLGFFVPLIFFGTQLFRESVEVYTTLSEASSRQHFLAAVIDNTGSTLEKFVPGSEAKLIALSYNVDEYLRRILTFVIDNLGAALSGVSTFLLDILIFLIALYYCIKDGHKLRDMLYRVSPLSTADNDSILTHIEHAINSIIKGNFLIALTQGAVATIGFLLCGVPNAVLWGMLAIIASLVPRIGTALVIFPAVVYLFITGSLLSAFFLALWGFGIVGVIDNILGPKLMGKELALHPLSVLFSVMGGIIFFGPAGIFLGPLTVSLLIAFISVYTSLHSTIPSKK